MLEKRSRVYGVWREWRGLLVFIVLMLGFRSVLADWYYVPSGSMKPTLIEGDRIFVNKLAYGLRLPLSDHYTRRWSGPSRGDMIVFDGPGEAPTLVKRVVAIAGDTVAMHRKRLWINGEPANYRDEIKHGQALQAHEILAGVEHAVMFHDNRLAASDFAPVTVPQGHVFVLGDNRDNSRDSRYFGFVPVEAINGRVVSVAFSLDPENYFLPRSERWFQGLR